MSFGADLRERLRGLFLRDRVERELDEELRGHLEREVAHRVRAGADPESARREALLALGGLEQCKEAVRDARGVRPLEELGADLRYALRSLRRRPGFTATAVLVLGLAIGAAAALFTVIQTVLFASLPYPAADRLVRVYQQNSPSNRWLLSTVDVQGILEHNRSFTAFGPVQYAEAALSGAGSPARVVIGRASAGFFRALQVTPWAGRLIEPADESPQTPAVAVVGYRLAERQLGGAASALGRSITIDGISHTVVGVLPPGRDELAGVPGVAWPVLRMPAPTRRGPFWLRGVGRLRDDAGLDAARADLAAVSRRLFPEWASGFRDSTARLTPVPLRASIVGGSVRGLALLGVAVSLVLLAAIANVATLLLVRTLAREHELAVRAALGAGRARLARLVAAESTLLALLAGLLGVGIAAIGLRFGSALFPGLPRLGEIGFGPAEAGIAVSLAAVTAVLAGAAPVWSVLTRSGWSGLAAGSRRTGLSRRSTALRTALVTTEFALALPLLLGAGLLLNSFMRLQRVDPGYDPEGLVSASLALPAARYPDYPELQRFWRGLEARVLELPGVIAAGLVGGLPPDDPGDINNFDLVDHPVAPGGAEPVSPWTTVTAGYFDALGIPLLQGRHFTPSDSGPDAPVVVVSRAWAERYFPEGKAVGRKLIAGGCTECPPTTVIGVVGNVKYLGLDGGGEAVYQPLAQTRDRSLHLVVRGGVPETETIAALRRELSLLDPELPVAPVTLASRLQSSVATPRRWALIVGGFAVVAVALASLGVFGLMSYLVRQRRREIGVRLALGAEPAAVVRLIVGQGVRTALLGLGCGLVLCLISARWLGQLLYEVNPLDAPTLALILGLLLAAASLASWLPARLAARIRPTEALGSE